MLFLEFRFRALLKALEKDIRQDLGLTCINIADIKPEPNKPRAQFSLTNESLPFLVFAILLIFLNINRFYVGVRTNQHLNDTPLRN